MSFPLPVPIHLDKWESILRISDSRFNGNDIGTRVFGTTSKLIFFLNFIRRFQLELTGLIQNAEAKSTNLYSCQSGKTFPPR